jgi:hypothetical protein
MRTFNLLASIGGMKPSQASSRRRKASSRALRVESLESRVPPSAFAVLLDFEASEQTDVILRSDIEEALTSATLDGAVTVGTFSAGEEAPSLPVLQPATTSVKMDLPETQGDILANDMVMEMGPAAWQPVAVAGDSGDMVFATSFGAPAPSQPGEPIGTDPITMNMPEIVWFLATTQMDNRWHFQGTVEYDQPQELYIRFGGLLEGESARVEVTGDFRFSWQFPVGTQGRVYAQAFTTGGDYSNEVYDEVIS